MLEHSKSTSGTKQISSVSSCVLYDSWRKCAGKILLLNNRGAKSWCCCWRRDAGEFVRLLPLERGELLLLLWGCCLLLDALLPVLSIISPTFVLTSSEGDVLGEMLIILLLWVFKSVDVVFVCAVVATLADWLFTFAFVAFCESIWPLCVKDSVSKWLLWLPKKSCSSNARTVCCIVESVFSFIVCTPSNKRPLLWVLSSAFSISSSSS